MAVNSLYYDKEDVDVELKDISLKKDFNGYYLAAKFKVEDSHSIRELDVPHIRFIDKTHWRDWVMIEEINDVDDDRAYINFGFGALPLDYGLSNGYRALFTEKVLEEKYKEMTLEEIEKKLGHKVKIVNR